MLHLLVMLFGYIEGKAGNVDKKQETRPSIDEVDGCFRRLPSPNVKAKVDRKDREA